MKYMMAAYVYTVHRHRTCHRTHQLLLVTSAAIELCHSTCQLASYTLAAVVHKAEELFFHLLYHGSLHVRQL